MSTILLDTNILVYAFDLREALKQKIAKDLIKKLDSEGAGRLSVQCLGEFFYVATLKLHLPPSEAYAQIENWRDAFPILSLTPQIVLEAARGVRDHKMAYYDAQMWATARLNQIPLLFSEDFQDGQVLESVRFINPFAERFDVEEWM